MIKNLAGDTRPRWSIGDILDRTDLTVLLDEHTESIGSGHRRRWHCPVPDHQDSHASVTIHTDGRGHERWRCWSGDDTHRGDAIDLVMATHHLARGAAIEHLASRAGLRVDQPLPPPRRRAVPSGPNGPVPLDPAVVGYVAACERVLWSRAGRPVRDWLASRGFSEELLRANRIGADPGRALMNRPRGLPTGRSIAATFPALDPIGEVAYVQSRYLQPQPGGPKYENPAAKLGSNPRAAWTVPIGEPRLQLLVVCEGIPDALTAAQHGVHSVAVLGAQAPDRSVVETLARHAADRGLELVAVIDADAAGRNSGARLSGLLNDLGATLRVVEPPLEGLDLNEWAYTEPAWLNALIGTDQPELSRSEIDPPGSTPEVSLP